jgi:nitroimidazol reductase NimA-like FMN-containing flavoprotein (pyridoxamine 5'-phosphate oxidase superfamily)
MRLRRVHAEFLALMRVVHVATADARGVPHVIPVCAVVDQGRLYFASGKTGRKIANLRVNPEIAVSADEYAEAWGRLRGVVVQGAARVHARNPTFRRIRRRLYLTRSTRPRRPSATGTPLSSRSRPGASTPGASISAGAPRRPGGYCW